eukprot:Nitzschia sp. Nitz4//scaffold41_size133979//128758//129894//NITZ4_003374-RA/size133979-snap-gene-0.113-mRNA-1//1//CDS//3329551551//8984//frame0
MYHRPVGISSMPSNDLRSRSIGRTAIHDNENVFKNSSSKPLSSRSNITPSKFSATTPGKNGTLRTGPRQAFGDISNKKSAKIGGNGSKDASAALGKPILGAHRNTSRQSEVQKPLGKSGLQDRSSRTFQSKIPTLGGGISGRAHPWSSNLPSKGLQTRQMPKPSTSISKSSAPTPSRRVDFLVPTRSHKASPEFVPSRAGSSTRESMKSKTPSCLKALDPVDEVELPSGRLWQQQLKTDDPLGNDDVASTSSMDELLDDRTMWDDWRETMRTQWENEKKRQNIQDDKIIRQQIEAILEKDYQDTGLESLVDWVENWDVFAKGEQSRVEHSIEEDEWSDPASSLDGIMGIGLDDM